MSPRSPGRLDPDELAALEEQRDFLLASIADLDREHDAGDLDDVDHANLRDEYTARAAEVLRAIDEQRAAFAGAKRPRDVRRTATTLVVVALFALVAGWFVARSMGAREAGGTASGGVDVKQTTSQRAQACIALIDPASPDEALDCFAAIRKEDPDNVVALTWSSWQLSLAADRVPADLAATLQATAAEQLTKAVTLQPDYSQARAFRAVVAYRSGDLAGAERYLADFEAHDPDADSRATLEQMDLAGLIAKAKQDRPTETTTRSTTTTTSVAGG